ncbi:MAG: STAS domain-containing protein [Melioribacteraceae bacterium]|nr:STAS domain-containing protein [Melioribacteraceae bacterium]
MSQSFQYQKVDERISEEFRQRIQQNIETAQNENFKSKILEHIPAVLITINLERAVFEQALLFRNYIMNYLESDHKNFILDFSETIFLDSTFLGSVIFFYKKVNSIGGTVRLVVNAERMTLLSQINNFSDIIETFASVDESIVNL